MKIKKWFWLFLWNCLAIVLIFVMISGLVYRFTDSKLVDTVISTLGALSFLGVLIGISRWNKKSVEGGLR